MPRAQVVIAVVLAVGAGVVVSRAASGDQTTDVTPRLLDPVHVAQTVEVDVAEGDDSDEHVTGPEADRAGRAAVDAVGGGRLVAVERENEGGTAWEVEVAQADGRQVEVELNRRFERIAVDRDDEGSDDD